MRLPHVTFLLVWFVSAGLARAQIGDDVPCEKIENVPYEKWKERDVTFDVLTPVSPKTGCGIILVASGSWKSQKQDYSEGLSGWGGELLKGGYTVFVVYHPNFDEGVFVPDMVKSVDRSVRFIRSQAKEYKVDPDFLGLTSGSSGGHLALMVALKGDDGVKDSDDPVLRVSNRVQAVVAWYAPTDFLNWKKQGSWERGEGPPVKTAEEAMGATGDKLTRILEEMSPVRYVTPDDPPVLMLHAMGDLVVPIYQSFLLEKALETVGVPNLLIVHRGFGHNRGPQMFKEYDPVRAWFRKYLIVKHKPQ
jgi:acetyl esterase/lipase